MKIKFGELKQLIEAHNTLDFYQKAMHLIQQIQEADIWSNVVDMVYNPDDIATAIDVIDLAASEGIDIPDEISSGGKTPSAELLAFANLLYDEVMDSDEYYDNLTSKDAEEELDPNY